MTFPDTPLGLRGELMLGSTLTDITGDLYTRDPITHTRGRQYRANAADPASCAATIRNLDGQYTPRNPAGPYYGLLGRNTPFRVSLPGTTTYLDATGAPDLASTPDAAALDITGDLDIRWEGEANWNGNGAQMLIGKWGDVGSLSYHLRLENGDLHLNVSTDGSFSWSFSRTLAALPRRAALRGTVDVDNGAGGMTGRLYWAPTLDGPWEQLGTDSVGHETISVFSSTAPLTIAPQQLSSDPDRLPVTGRVYRAEVRNGIDGPVVAAPDFTAQAAGTESFTDSAGRVWTLTAGGEITDRVIRFNGEVPEWPPKWEASEADAWTPIQAAGILRRMSQGQKALESALTRRVPSFNPVAYWPMEEGINATRCYSPIAGVQPMSVSGFDMASNDTLAGSKPLPTIREGATLSAIVPAPAGSPTEWHTEFLFKMDAPPPGDRTVIQWLGTGTVRQWKVMVTAGGARFYGYDADGTVVVSNASAFPALYGKWYRWKLYCTQNGSAVDWVENWTAVGESNVQVSGSYTGKLGRISKVTGPPGYSSDLTGVSIGHIGVFTQANTFAYNNGDIGFAGETAAARMLRLAGEENLDLAIFGDVSETEPVGPQRPTALLDLLRESAAADGGIFGESVDRRQLVYRTRASLYNQVPKLTLDYAAGQLAPPFEPVEDDQVRNDWQVTRTGGSAGRATLTEGALSVQDPPNGIGLYDDSVSLNLDTDEQTDPMAAWLLHLTSWDEARYPSVTVRLHRSPELIPDVLGLDVGDKIRIENLPVRFAGARAVELLVDGWTETLLPRTWEITFNCSPAGPWNVGELPLTEGFEDTDLTITATDGGDLPWGRTQNHYNGGVWSLQSGAITNNQTSDYVVSVPTGMTELRFWYRTSSEESGPGFEGDRLTVLVDGNQVLRAQGETPWSPTTLNVTGARSVTFRYAKDNSGSAGEDAAWIDDLMFIAGTPARADSEGSTLAADAAATDTELSVAVSTGRTWILYEEHEDDFPFDILVGGERMTVTAISGATSPQTFTVVRSVNDVVKPQTADTPVRLADPTFVAL